ncbi:MAG: hypothetical protein ABWX56_01550 [Mycetocola sp.]
MQISGDYGTELLLRYTDEQLLRDLERRRVGDERRAETRALNGHASILGRLAAVFRADNGADNRADTRMRRPGRGVSQVHAAHR